MADETPSALEGIRVLDLTTEMGQYCGKLLADLGADVIKVEPPGGDHARALGPFFHGESGPEASISYWYFNTNKRSLTCNLNQPDGQSLFHRLVATADVIVESFPPGHMDARGLGADAVRGQRPDLIYASITGFGLSGPHRDWRAPDIVGQAMGGIMVLAGHPQDPPNLITGDQGYICASITAAEGIMLAILHKDQTGAGQLVEVSMQEALSVAQETAVQYWDFQKIARGRRGDFIVLPGTGTYRTADGYIYSMVGVAGHGGAWPVLLDWMQAEGKSQGLEKSEHLEVLNTLDMRTLTAARMDSSLWKHLQSAMDRAQEVVSAFYASKSSRDIFEQGQGRRLLIGMVSSPQDLLDNPHLNARDWYRTVTRNNEKIQLPGPPYILERTTVQYRRMASAPGADNTAVWGSELGVSPHDLTVYAGEGVI